MPTASALGVMGGIKAGPCYSILSNQLNCMTQMCKNRHNHEQNDGGHRQRIDDFIGHTAREVMPDLECSHASLVIVSRLLNNDQSHNVEICPLEPNIISLNEQVQGSQLQGCRTLIKVTKKTTVKKDQPKRSEEWSAGMMEVLEITKKLLGESDRLAFKKEDEFLNFCANNPTRQKKANLF